MTLKEEISTGESYFLEFKRLPNEDRGKYLKTVVAFINEPVRQNETVNDPVKPNDPLNEPVNEPLNQVLKLVMDNPGISRVNLIARIGRSRATITRMLSTLKSEGKIEHRGSDKTGGYYAI